MKKCPYCDKEFSAQGLVGHVQFKHGDELKNERAEYASELTERADKLKSERVKHTAEREKDAERTKKLKSDIFNIGDALKNECVKSAKLKDEVKSERVKHTAEREKDADESKTGKIIGIGLGIIIGLCLGKDPGLSKYFNRL